MIKIGLIVWCKDEAEAKAFLKEAYKNGFTWEGNFSEEYTGWDKCEKLYFPIREGEGLCYRIKEDGYIGFQSYLWYKDNYGGEIKNFSDIEKIERIKRWQELLVK